MSTDSPAVSARVDQLLAALRNAADDPKTLTLTGEASDPLDALSQGIAMAAGTADAYGATALRHIYVALSELVLTVRHDLQTKGQQSDG